MPMSRSFSKTQLCKIYRWMLSCINNEYHEDDLRRSALVFSPHFDDETLGCGGTILKKKRAGADVKIVFMSDGSKSHRLLIAENKLSAIRASEGLAASRSLGLNASDVFLLEFEETKLSEYVDSATKRVTEILLRQKPDEIFIPYHKEPALWSKDHLATNRIVCSSLQMYDRDVVIYEYPIWFWYHWPWMSAPINNLRQLLFFLKDSLVSPLTLLREFRCSVYIGDVLELKRAALNQHKSQMTRLIPDPRWRTLCDISNGEFLECFFQEYEIFHQYVLHEGTACKLS